MEHRFHTCSPEETELLGEKIGRVLRAGDIVAFRGGLGAGKTAMTAGIARGMGVKDEVSSPTFAIVNVYRGDLPLVHFDMYRIPDPEALESVGFYDYLSEDCVIAIEWSENISEALPESAVTVELVPNGNDREIIINGDERFDL